MGSSRYSPRMGFKTLSFFCPVLGGPPGEAGSAPLRRADRYGVSCRRRTGSSVSLVGSPLESGVSPAHIGPCNACHRAAPETTPFIHTHMWQRGFTPPRLAIPREGHVKGINHEHISVPGRKREGQGRCSPTEHGQGPARSFEHGPRGSLFQGLLQPHAFSSYPSGPLS